MSTNTTHIAPPAEQLPDPNAALMALVAAVQAPEGEGTEIVYGRVVNDIFFALDNAGCFAFTDFQAGQDIIAELTPRQTLALFSFWMRPALAMIEAVIKESRKERAEQEGAEQAP
jgi:hypothetical protein